MADEKVSSSCSMRGWDIRIWFDKNKLWFIKNKDTIKALIAGIAGIIASSYPTNDWIKLCFGLGGAYITKMICDSVDYYCSEVKL